MIIKTIVELAWAWIKANIKLPFNQEMLKKQAMEVAFNQGLPALVTSLEKQVPEQYRENLNHRMWQAVKQATQSNDPEQFVEQVSTALQNSGEADRMMEFLQKS